MKKQPTCYYCGSRPARYPKAGTVRPIASAVRPIFCTVKHAALYGLEQSMDQRWNAELETWEG